MMLAVAGRSLPRFFNEQGFRIASVTDECERQVLTELWLSPDRTYDAACDAGLTGEHFSLTDHSVIFCYVCRCHECGIEHTPVECILAADRAGVPLEPRYLKKIILADTRHDRVTFYAENLAGLVERRKRLASATLECADALYGNEWDIHLTMTRKATRC